MNKMLKKSIGLLNNKQIQSTIYRNYAATIKEKWDLYTAVVVERLPVITKPLENIEKEYQVYLQTIELENSLKSDHELRHEKDLIQAEQLKKGDIETDFDVDLASKQTAQDMEDLYVEEFNKFKLASRTTEDDRSNNIKSTNRKLEENLILVVEQQLGKDRHLLLPQGKRKDGETMRQAAERAFKEICGENIEAKFYGNGPCGFHKYKYPASERKDTVGAKIFFYRSVLTKGNVNNKINFQWANKEELNKIFNGSYRENVSQFML